MGIREKAQQALKIIARARINCERPILACSFGKDSTVMLDIARRNGLNFPVVFHREPYSPKKYEFANRLIQEWDLVVYDYPPLYTSVGQIGERIEIMNEYVITSDNRTNRLPTGVKDPVPGEPFLCGYSDLYCKPTGKINYVWDGLLIGHKSSDVDYLLGEIPLATEEYVVPNALTLFFPLRHFTDSDIWEYTELFSVPYNEKRYNKTNGYKEFEDITYNNDWHYACTSCLDEKKPGRVFCPKVKREIENISGKVRRCNVGKMDYMEQGA